MPPFYSTLLVLEIQKVAYESTLLPVYQSDCPSICMPLYTHLIFRLTRSLCCVCVCVSLPNCFVFYAVRVCVSLPNFFLFYVIRVVSKERRRLVHPKLLLHNEGSRLKMSIFFSHRSENFKSHRNIYTLYLLILIHARIMSLFLTETDD
jgi:hypothetical protein